MKKKTEAQLRKILEETSRELRAITSRRETKQLQKYVGKYFKYHNCYSNPTGEEDYWWLYIHVKEMRDTYLYVTKFQTDNGGIITLELDTSWYPVGEFIEIPKCEFVTAWQILREHIEEIYP